MIGWTSHRVAGVTSDDSNASRAGVSACDPSHGPLPSKQDSQRTRFLQNTYASPTHEPAAGGRSAGRAPNAEAGLETDVVVLDDPSLLSEYVDQWEDLAAEAIEPNVFYEPWMLLPAIENFAKEKTLRFVLIFVKPSPSGDERILSGFFPLERRGRYRGLPVPVSGLWRHVHCFLSLPLIRREWPKESLRAFINWSQSAFGESGILEFPWVPTDGPFRTALREVLDEVHTPSMSVEEFSRGFADATGDFELYLNNAISGKGQREIRRKERRLGAAELVEYRQLKETDSLGPWIEEFLTLEASGWKGRQSTAMGCSEDERRFFVSTLEQGFRLGKLLMTSVRVAGAPIAIQCSMLSGEGAFAFKTAYDERYARCSPGVLLQIETIRQIHNSSRVAWLDSCAAPNSFAVNRVCTGRRNLDTVLAATGGVAGRLLVSTLPVLRGIKRKLSN